MGDGAVVNEDAIITAATDLHGLHGQIPEGSKGNARAGIGINAVLEPPDGGRVNGGGVSRDVAIFDHDVIETAGYEDTLASDGGCGAEGEAIEI